MVAGPRELEGRVAQPRVRFDAARDVREGRPDLQKHGARVEDPR